MMDSGSSSLSSSNGSGERSRRCISNKLVAANAIGGLGTNSLSIPTGSPSRKLSLQPFNNRQIPSSMNDHLMNNMRKKSIAFNNNASQHQQQQQQQLSQLQQQPSQLQSNSQQHLNLTSNYAPASASATNANNNNNNQPSGLSGSVSNLNVNLNVASSPVRLVSRKSIIGKLGRSSFQAQRLSDVGVAVGQQITAKMGLKLPASQERIVEQTRCLYMRYVFVKLRQNALPVRDLNLTKSSSRARRNAAILNRLPDVTCSEPPAAIPSDSFPNTDYCGGNSNNSVRLSRKRTAISQSINSQDLSFLAARMQAVKFKNESNFTTPTSSRSNSTYGTAAYKSDVNCFTSADAASSTRSSNSIINPSSNYVSQQLNNKKYIMDPTINNQIFTVIVKIIKELRDLKPEFYGDTIYELIGMDKFASLQTVLDVQKTICQEMIRSEISWCRISALFSLFGAMSLDCVRLGSPEHVGPILDGFIEFVERDLALWISQQGGWEAFLYKYRAGSRFGGLTSKVAAVTLPFLIWAALYFFE